MVTGKMKNKIKKSDKLLGEGKFLKLWNRKSWEFVQRKGSTGVAIIVAMTDDQKVVLVEQFRVPVGKRVIELPAGLVGDKDASESITLGARRELFEETGWLAKKVEVLVKGPAASGMSCEELTFCLASGLVKKGPGGGDEMENITTYEIPLNQVESWLKKQQKKGKRIDPKIFSGLYFLTQSLKVKAKNHSPKAKS